MNFESSRRIRRFLDKKKASPEALSCASGRLSFLCLDYLQCHVADVQDYRYNAADRGLCYGEASELLGGGGHGKSVVPAEHYQQYKSHSG